MTFKYAMTTTFKYAFSKTDNRRQRVYARDVSVSFKLDNPIPARFINEAPAMKDLREHAEGIDVRVLSCHKWDKVYSLYLTIPALKPSKILSEEHTARTLEDIDLEGSLTLAIEQGRKASAEHNHECERRTLTEKFSRIALNTLAEKARKAIDYDAKYKAIMEQVAALDEELRAEISKQAEQALDKVTVHESHYNNALLTDAEVNEIAKGCLKTLTTEVPRVLSITPF